MFIVIKNNELKSKYTLFKKLPIQRVYASDLLQLKIAPNTAIVANTDPHTTCGTHCLTLFLDNHDYLKFFDSFGKPPSVLHHMIFTRRNGKRFNFNSKNLQTQDSLVCGHYCLVYLMFRTCELIMRDFQPMFNVNINENDLIVYHTLKHFYD